MAGDAMQKAGFWAFMVGFFGSILVGLLTWLEVFEAGGVITTFLVLAGLAIGYLNITQDESTAFMVAFLVLAATAGVLSLLPVIGPMLESVTTGLVSVFGPAALVVAFNEIRVKAR